jgi:hypothetical protein
VLVNWLDQTLDELKRQPGIGYKVGDAPAAEPTALAVLALAGHGRVEAARKAADALASMQQTNGEVAVRAGEQWPGWPTSLAVCAWCAIDRSGYQHRIDLAIRWLLANRGQPVDQSEAFGHNTALVGWAYAEQTHSWIEPTAFGVLAMKSAGRPNEPAAREGVAVLIDRQLPGGGLNYGNTYVLGQLIRAHTEPTGIGLVALAGESDPSHRLAKSIAWLRRSIGPETTPLSLGWSSLGLKAQRVDLPDADAWLESAASRVQMRDRSPHKLALLALAAKGWPA